MSEPDRPAATKIDPFADLDLLPDVELSSAGSRLADLIEEGGFDWWTSEISFDLGLWLVDEGMVLQQTAETAAELADLAGYFEMVVVREEPRGDDRQRTPAIWEYILHSGWARVGQAFNPDDQTPTLPVTAIYSQERECGPGPT